jgi:beta-glucosidase/6-phospho-beta-glucosidase/beta-galactosidase
MSRTRKALLLVCSLAAFLGAAIATLAEIQRRDYELRGYANATKTLDLPYRIPRQGVNADLTQYTPEELATHLDRMEAAGITRVRQPFFWDRIQPAAENFVWDDYDVVVQAVAEHPELELVAVLLHSPEWARQPETTATTPPTDVAEFAAFAAEFAARYGDSIEVYQVWDEPNIALGWGNDLPKATYYASLLHAAYNAIHETDATAQVLSAALAPTVETGPQNYNELQ